MAQINWTDQAKADLVKIGEFIAKDSVKYAILTIQRIRERARQLKSFPFSGRVVPEVEIKELREIVFGNYRIIYQIISSTRIDVITVHHTSQEFKDEAGNENI